MPTGKPPVTADGRQVARIIVPQRLATKFGLAVGMRMHANGDIPERDFERSAAQAALSSIVTIMHRELRERAVKDR